MSIDELVNSLWFSLSGYIFGLLGLIFSYIFYRKSISEKCPVFSLRSMSVFNDKRLNLFDIEVRYKGNIVDSLSITKFVFFNSGKVTIEGEIYSKNSLLLFLVIPITLFTM